MIGAPTFHFDSECPKLFVLSFFALEGRPDE